MGKERRLAAFLAEGMQSCGGQIVPAPGYLRNVAAEVRKRGGVMIADEVQTAFGRVGTHFYAYELDHDMQSIEAPFVPDILTLAKPIGNGYPVGGANKQQNPVHTTACRLAPL